MWTESLLLASVAAAAALVLTALVQVLSALLERSGPIRLHHWAEETGGRLLELYEQPHRFEAFRYLLGLAAKLAPIGLLVALVPICGMIWARPQLWALLITLLTVGVTETISRFLVGRDPERALSRNTFPYRILLFLLNPLLFVLAPLFPASVVERREDENDVTDDEIEAFINVGTQEGILEPGEEDLILRVIDFGDTVVRSVVTPRIDMVCASCDIGLEEMAELFLTSRHSRIPIYRETVDQIVGVLHIRDLLRGLREGGKATVLDLAMEPYFVPESKALDDLLKEFQAERQQLAIVVDEYGGTAGMVTIEDLLEEIVGEIEDEYDEAAPQIETLSDGRWRVDGREPLESLEDLFDIDLEQEPYETLGGLIFGHLGYVPEPGEEVIVHGLVLKAEEVESRRIQKVLVSRVPQEQGGGA